MAVVEGHQAALGGRQRRLGERRDDSGPGSPRDVEARDRVAVAGGGEIAAFGPADAGQELDALIAEVTALVAGGELDIGSRPSGGPQILIIEPVEARAALPVVPGQFQRVGDPHPALFGAVHQEDPAERPEGLAAQIRCVLLVHHGHPLAAAGQFESGDQPGKARSDDDHICIHEDNVGIRTRRRNTDPPGGLHGRSRPSL